MGGVVERNGTEVPDRRGALGHQGCMQPMKFFIDTHDSRNETFPAGIERGDFADFYVKYEEACRAEGVISLRVHVGFGEGRAFCFTMAPDADAVRRAHARVGLPIDEIIEVETATPGDVQVLARAAAQSLAHTG